MAPTQPVFLYLTGGLAVGEVDASYTGGIVGGPMGAVNVSSTKAGWTVGAGGEGRLGQSNWTLKLEYLYMDFGDVSGAVGGTGAPVKTLFGINNTDLIHFLTTTTTIAGIASTHVTDQSPTCGPQLQISPTLMPLFGGGSERLS